MRITTVIAGLSGGGAERVCVNLANAWAARGWDVTILTVSQRTATPAYAIDSYVRRRDTGWPRGADPKELNANESSLQAWDALLDDVAGRRGVQRDVSEPVTMRHGEGFVMDS